MRFQFKPWFMLMLITLAINHSSFSQPSANAIWKKRVYRIIDLADSVDEANNKINSSVQGETLIYYIEKATHSGKLPFYSVSEPLFTKEISKYGLYHDMCIRPHYDSTIDPKTKEVVYKTWRDEFPLRYIHQFALLEDWEYNSSTGKTIVQIIGIGLAIDCYGDDGTFRRKSVTDWFKYEDVLPLIKQYEQYNPSNTLSKHIWADYLGYELKQKETKQLYRTIDLADTNRKTRNNTYTLTEDSTLAYFIERAVASSRVPSYSAQAPLFSKKLTPKDLADREYLKTDTALVYDPILEEDVLKTRKRDFPYSHVNEYSIAENWTYSPTTGRTEMQITGIGPTLEEYSSGYNKNEKKQVLYWVKYKDVHPILNHYEQYHPNNTISQHIWNDYFTSDIKPKEIR